MEHLLLQIPLDVCDYMPCQLNWCQLGYCNGWVFWSIRQDDELNYQRTISPMMSAAPVVSSSPMAILKIKTIIAKLWFSAISLVQYWAPIKVNGSTFLSTADQPFAFHKKLDKRLFEYRRLCLDNLIPIDMYNEGLLGPPGRVFGSGLPEFNPDVRSYSTGEFPLLENAIRLGIHFNCAIPVFNLHDQHCVGVFEIASTEVTEPAHLILEILKVSELYRWRFFQALKLRDDAGFDQIETGLDEILKIHSLPFAQIWIPDSQSRSIKVLVHAGAFSYDHSSSIYDEFEYVSEFCVIESGKALVGRAFSSQGSYFCKDVTLLSLKEYPLVPSARKARLTQSFAICLQSKCANNIVCVVEYFLPPNEMDTKTFLNMLLSTMKEQLPGVRVASGEELGQRMLVEVVKISPSDELDSFEIGQSLPSVQSLQDGGETTKIDSLCQQSNLQNGENNVATALLVPSCSSHKRDSLNCERRVQVDILLPHPTEEAVTNNNVDVAHDDHIEFEKDRGEMMQPDSSFEQPNVEIDSTAYTRSNDKLEHNNIARCLPVVEAEAINEDSNFISGTMTNIQKINSQKNNKIPRIEKDHKITRDILEQ